MRFPLHNCLKNHLSGPYNMTEEYCFGWAMFFISTYISSMRTITFYEQQWYSPNSIGKIVTAFQKDIIFNDKDIYACHHIWRRHFIYGRHKIHWHAYLPSAHDYTVDNLWCYWQNKTHTAQYLLYTKDHCVAVLCVNDTHAQQWRYYVANYATLYECTNQTELREALAQHLELSHPLFMVAFGIADVTVPKFPGAIDVPSLGIIPYLQGYTCPAPHCGKSFTTKKAFDKHMRTHKLEKPFQCEACGKYFSQRAHLHRHACPKKAVTLKFKCSTCGLPCASASNLRTHERTHQPPHLKCPHCDAKFHRTAHVNRHVRTKHEIIADYDNRNTISIAECLYRHPLIYKVDTNPSLMSQMDFGEVESGYCQRWLNQHVEIRPRTIRIKPAYQTFAHRFYEVFQIENDAERPSLNGQYGVRAVVDIKPKCLLGIYVGEYFDAKTKQLSAEEERYAFEVDGSVAGIDYHFYICAYPKGNDMARINANTTYAEAGPAAKAANVQTVKVCYKGRILVLIEAIAAIPKGTELLLDYGRPYWEGQEQ